jgi:hypothetical protein
MSWARWDDGFYDHPKTKAATRKCPASVGIFVRAVTYCSKHETDGKVPREVLEEWFFFDQELLNTAIATLIEVGFLETKPEGAWVHDNTAELWIHDYLDYNASHAEREKERAAARKRMKKRRKEQSAST